MHEYELTERGKIVIAALIVLLLFVLSGILMYKAWANQSSAPPADPNSESHGALSPSPYETPPVISDSPPPTGGVFTPPVISTPSEPSGNDVQGSEETPDTPELTKPPDSGLIDCDPSEGTLSFLFSPDRQSELDNEIISAFGDLLSSLNNTRDSMIAVETPPLSDSDTEKLMDAVADAFVAHGIPARRLTWIMRPYDNAGETFEVKLYFVRSSGK